MRDERQHNQQHENGHYRASEESSEALPTDLEPVHQQLLRDSDGWTRRLPEAETLASYARGLASGTATAILLLDPTAEREHAEDAGEPSDAYPHPLSTRGYARHQPRSRRNALLALAAAVAVVALMAAVLTSLAPHRGPASGEPTASVTATETAIPTATPRPAYGPIRGSWQPAPYLQNQPGEPTFAPSDPRVVYEAVFTQTNGAEPVGQYATLRRSEDGGKSWQTLSVPKPQDAAVTAWGPAGVLVSPNDSRTVILSVTSQLSYTTPAGCPADQRTADAPQHGGILADGFVRCATQYVSRDGGGTWTPITVAGVTALPTNGFDALYAQGDRLYALYEAGTQFSDQGSYRVVASADGIHWSLVDSAPLAASKQICSFIAVPTGSTVFALTTAGTCDSFDSPPPQLWRSDDGGLHWRDIGPLGGQQDHFAAAQQGPEDAQPTLYLVAVTLSGAVSNEGIEITVRVSGDGGYTWHQAPTAGLPDGYHLYQQLRGTLADGSVVMQYISPANGGPRVPTTVGLYAWHAGDAEWHQIAPPLTVADSMTLDSWTQMFVSAAGGTHGTAYDVQFEPTRRAYSVETYSS